MKVAQLGVGGLYGRCAFPSLLLLCPVGECLFDIPTENLREVVVGVELIFVLDADPGGGSFGNWHVTPPPVVRK